MNSEKLEQALADFEASLRLSLNSLRYSDDDAELCEKLDKALHLTGCLRRLARGRTVHEIHQAFGAPGDFGYDTPIGEALCLLYRGES